MAADMDTVGPAPGSFVFPFDDVWGLPDVAPTIPAGAESGVPAGLSDAAALQTGASGVHGTRAAGAEASIRHPFNQPLFWSAALIAIGYALLGVAAYVDAKAA